MCDLHGCLSAVLTSVGFVEVPSNELQISAGETPGSTHLGINDFGAKMTNSGCVMETLSLVDEEKETPLSSRWFPTGLVRLFCF